MKNCNVSFLKLPISLSPSVISYAHHAYSHCILESQNNISSNIIKLEVPQFEYYEWEYINDDVEIVNENNLLHFSSEEYAKNTECFITRRCEEDDELLVKVNYYQYTNASAVINMVISGENIKDCVSLNENIYRFGILRKRGVFVQINNNYCCVNEMKYKKNYPFFIRLQKKNCKISASISVDGEKWDLVSEETITGFDNNTLRIGINTNTGENQYYNWLYMNYIQLFYNSYDDFVWLDYCMFPQKNYNYNYIHHFMDFNKDTFDDITEMFSDIIEYLRWCLYCGYYIEIWLDEYYIPNRIAYQKEHYIHPNLVYGFDDTKQIFNVVGYNIKLEDTLVPYNLLRKSFTKLSRECIVERIKYNTDDKTLFFNKDLFIIKVKEYLTGINSSLYIANMVPIQEGTYGIKIYEILLNTERGKELLCNDKRISYVLYEHNLIMKKRLEYFESRNILSHEQIEKIFVYMDEIMRYCEYIKNAVIKNTLIKESIDERILSSTKELYRIEKNFYEQLIKCLQV